MKRADFLTNFGQPWEKHANNDVFWEVHSQLLYFLANATSALVSAPPPLPPFAPHLIYNAFGFGNANSREPFGENKLVRVKFADFSLQKIPLALQKKTCKINAENPRTTYSQILFPIFFLFGFLQPNFTQQDPPSPQLFSIFSAGLVFLGLSAVYFSFAFHGSFFAQIMHSFHGSFLAKIMHSRRLQKKAISLRVFIPEKRFKRGNKASLHTTGNDTYAYGKTLQKVAFLIAKMMAVVARKVAKKVVKKVASRRTFFKKRHQFYANSPSKVAQKRSLILRLNNGEMPMSPKNRALGKSPPLVCHFCAKSYPGKGDGKLGGNARHAFDFFCFL